MLSFYDVSRERTFWVNVDHIVSLTAVNKNDTSEGTYIDTDGYPLRITVDKKPREVVELIEKEKETKQVIEVYDAKEEEFVMVNVSKIIVVYHSFDRKSVLIEVDELDEPIRTSESYEEVKDKIKVVTNVG